jgi:Na+-driven multidrug efflux pump
MVLTIRGMQGAPIATSILNIVFAVGLASYVKWKRLYEETWVDWDWSQIFDMAGWKEIWGLGMFFS